MDCSAFRRHHVAYVDDTLPGDLVVAAARHAAECPACARHDTAVRRALMLARNLGCDSAPALECSPDFGARLEARLAAVRAECRRGGAPARPTPDPAVPGAAGDSAGDDWTPTWRELAAARVAAIRARPVAAAAAALVALTTGATLHTAARAGGGDVRAAASAPAPFGSPFSSPPTPLAVAVEQPIFDPAAGPAPGPVVGWVTYDGAGAAAVDPGTLVAPAATGVPVWAAAVLAGAAPAALWRDARPRPVPALADEPIVRAAVDTR